MSVSVRSIATRQRLQSESSSRAGGRGRGHGTFCSRTAIQDVDDGLIWMAAAVVVPPTTSDWSAYTSLIVITYRRRMKTRASIAFRCMADRSASVKRPSRLVDPYPDPDSLYIARSSFLAGTLWLFNAD